MSQRSVQRGSPRSCYTRIGTRVIAGSGRRKELESVDAGGEARQLARDGVLVQDALGRGPVHLGLGDLKRGLRRLLVAGLDRRLDLLDKGAHPAQPRAVDRGARFGLAEPFLGG